MSTPYVQVVPTCDLGEGPHWNAAKQELLYVDITGQNVHRYVPATGEHTQVHINQGEAALVVPVEGEANKYIVGVGRSLLLMEWDGRSTEPTSLTNMFTVEPDQPDNSWNDGKCDSKGRLWAGTMNANNPVANLYRVTDTIQRVQSGIGISNGISWSSDNRLMFYQDSATGKVDVFDFDNEAGAISNRRTIYDFAASGERGSPDGNNIDSDGNLWVACWGGNQVIQINPTTRQKIRAIELPASNITSIAFGGTDLDIMYVTSASDGLSDAQKRQQPAAGSLFQITNTGVKGQGPGNNFKFA